MNQSLINELLGNSVARKLRNVQDAWNPERCGAEYEFVFLLPSGEGDSVEIRVEAILWDDEDDAATDGPPNYDVTDYTVGN